MPARPRLTMKPTPLILSAGAILAVIAAPARAQGPTLVPAALTSMAPTGVRRGQTATFTLSGVNISAATKVVFDDPAITGAVAPGGSANSARVTAMLGDTARIGIHTLYLQTPLGTTGSVAYAVGGWPEVPETEPNDSAGSAPLVTLPATVTGVLDRVGDDDLFRFRAEAGQELVFQVIAAQVRSRLSAVLSLLDEGGKVLAETRAMDGRADPILGYRFEQAGTYALRIGDFENASGGDVYYRVNAGALPVATRVFPLTTRTDLQPLTVSGWNLPETVLTGAKAPPNATVNVGDLLGPEKFLVQPAFVVGATESEFLERDRPNDVAAAAQQVTLPVTVNGRIHAEKGSDVDCYRFKAKKGQRVLLETNARRLGSPLDSVIEVLDLQGKPVERATLRCLAETVLTLSDRDSASTGLRFLAWNDFRVNDYVYIQGEIAQIQAMPLGPDEDLRMRNVRGVRVGFFDTTPIGHAVNTPMYKVQIHPPGATFPPNGMPVFRLNYRNDDGPPGYGKDSRLFFTAPYDGDFVVRIADVRGAGSERHAYRLTLREPRPDFRLSLSMDQPNVPAGASMPLTVTADRIDGMNEDIVARLENLPTGFTSTFTVIEGTESTATLILIAGPEAKTLDAQDVRLVGQAVSGGAVLPRTFPLAGGRPRFTVLPKADLTVRTTQKTLTLTPGQQQTVEASITRENGFAGRVPIELKNLPFGVRVLDIGLNGVLITEAESSRRFVVYCEPWVRPTKRTIYCTVKTETGSPAPTEVAAEPIQLEVKPGAPKL